MVRIVGVGGTAALAVGLGGTFAFAGSHAHTASMTARARSLVTAERQARAHAGSSGPARHSTAHVASGCWNDPSGDVTDLDDTPADVPAADIVSYCATNATTFTLSLKVAAPADPRTDPSWTSGGAGVLWDLDVDGDGSGDFEVMYADDASGKPTTLVTDPDFDNLCTGTAGFDGTSYTATFPANCIGSPASTTVAAFVSYDSNPDDESAPVYADVTDFNGPVTSSAPAGSGRITGRLAGGDRYATAVAISQQEFPDGARTVYLARADGYADALAGGALTGGPVLLVPRCGTVPKVVLDEIHRLKPIRVFALGDTNAVCASVLTQAAGA